MAVHFTMDQMKRCQENHNLWWEGKLQRPLTRVTINDAHPLKRQTKAPFLSQSNCADFSYTPEEIIDAMDAHLSKYEFLGDAFPSVNFDAFGPGVLAAMCGAILDNSSGRVWFFPDKAREIRDIHIKYDPENMWSRRIKDIYRAGLERWRGLVIMGFPDLGGVLDVAATFRGTENLLLDMIDEPEEVERLVKEIEKAWREAYEDFRSVLAPQGAYTHWSGLMSTEKSYIVQCDASYMIGKNMFDRFVLDTIRNDTQCLKHTIYHLDGIGQLNHLDSILSLEKLNAVQWVYGEGKPGPVNWLHVYRKIMDAGKQIMIVGGPEEYLETLKILHGTPYSTHDLSVNNKDLAYRLIEAR
ncbi:MAG: hypothetical protein IIX93_05985 [Clostridia bacterium]|nr:hypothetical protein [Clostridia bacterium]